MGTTRIKVIDLASGEKAIKTSRKHAEKLSGAQKIKDSKNETPINQETQIAPESESSTVSSETQQTTETSEQKDPEIEEVKETKKSSKKTTKKTSHHIGKNYIKAKALIEDKEYPLTEALAVLPETSFVKFDPTVEVHLTVSDKNIKGSVTFPHLKAEVKEKKYLIFADKKIETDKKVIWAQDKTIGEIEDGTLKPGRDFEVVIASPKFMPTIAKLAKILGPKGMMPNPKNGTITDNIEKILKGDGSQAASQYKTDPTTPVIHSKIGKLSQNSDEIKANLNALSTAIGKSKIKKATITTTMGPSIRLVTASI